MDLLLEALEMLLDEVGNTAYEVEYSVSRFFQAMQLSRLTFNLGLMVSLEWCPHLKSCRQRNIRYQQATTKQANMAVFTS